MVCDAEAQWPGLEAEFEHETLSVCPRDGMLWVSVCFGGEGVGVQRDGENTGRENEVLEKDTI